MREVAVIAVGLVLGLAAFGGHVACSGGSLPPIVRCKLDALKVLPSDVDMVTVGDARDIYLRVKACHRDAADGGT